MHFLLKFADLFIHLDKYMGSVIAAYGTWTYALLFFIIFCETGLVVTPFLPGDSLLFAAGAFAAKGSFQIGVLFLLLWSASVAGDNTNYWIGRLVGSKLLEKNLRLIKREHLDRTQAFYDKHGGKAVILGKFFPIIRTFVPFVAGVGKMNYGRFLLSNLTGGGLWIALFSFGGFFFGNLPTVRHNFTLVIFVIIGISFVPAGIEFLRHRRAPEKPKSGTGDLGSAL